MVIHARLMAHVVNAQRIAGVLRTTQNWIGGNDYNPCGADFVPPPPQHVGALLIDLCAAINDETLPPLVQAALVHAQFETIHPFADGNGRTGRALVQVVLRRRGLAPDYVPPISVVLANAKDGSSRGSRTSVRSGWRPGSSTATGRGKAPVYDAIRQLVAAGVLVPLSRSARNQSWEAGGLMEVLEEMEA